MCNIDKETWKDIPGYEGYYQISNYGKLKSLARKKWCGKCYRDFGERIIKGGIYSGYRKHIISKEGKIKFVGAHQLVLWAFRGLPKKKRQTRHLDGNRLNNHLSNLRWGTAKENAEDRINHGNSLVGSKNTNSKLNEDVVYVIRRLQEINIDSALLQRVFGISGTNLLDIKHRRIWRHVI